MSTYVSPIGNPEIWREKPEGYFTVEEWGLVHPFVEDDVVSEPPLTVATLGVSIQSLSEAVDEKLDTPVFVTSQQTFHIQDKKGNGITGGTFTAGAWRTRTLNSTIANTIEGASLVNNQITLPEGMYLIDAVAPAFNVNNHQARLYNITTSSILITGTTEYSSDWGWTMTASKVAGMIVLDAESVLELQHYCNTTYADSGFGHALYSDTLTDMENVYANIIIRRFS